MKKLVNKTKGLIRGTSTAVLLSVVIHAVLFFAAGVWVVFKFIDAQEAKFVAPPPLERPKMQLKKLRVKVKPTAKPRKSTQRITSTRKTAAMPDIQLPEMTGMGAGLQSVGGFEMMADMSEMTIFGGGKSMGNDLEGTLYYMMWNRQGEPIPAMASGSNAAGWPVNALFRDEVNKFLVNNWSPLTFAKYYRSPKKLYATQFMLPKFGSDRALQIYDMPEGQEAARYVIHYKGKISHPTGGKFRFWGTGDDFFFVRINKKLILDARTTIGKSYSGHRHNAQFKTPNGWKSSSKENMKHLLGTSSAKISDWFVLEPGVPIEMEVLIGEDMGGRTSALLNVQEFGVEYPENGYGSPILPAFKTAPIPDHIVDELEYLNIPGDTDLRGGPIFGAY